MTTEVSNINRNNYIMMLSPETEQGFSSVDNSINSIELAPRVVSSKVRALLDTLEAGVRENWITIMSPAGLVATCIVSISVYF